MKEERLVETTESENSRLGGKVFTPASLSRVSPDSPRQSPAVIIVGPPWPRSGTARVIQNQIDYYRARGYFSAFIAVPFFWYHVGQNPTEIVEAMTELGADGTFAAGLERKRYNAARYKASVRHAFRGTALDWQVAVGKAARLSDDDTRFLSQLKACLIHVNHVYTLGFALNLRKRLWGSLPIVLETHDIQSHLLQDRGDRNPWTHRPDPLERLVKSETALLDRANVLLHLSVDDFDFFRRLLPSKPHFLAFPTIDENFSSAVQEAAAPIERSDLLFVGQSHHPNREAVKWFLEQVWPLIAEHRYNLKIVGPIESVVRRDMPQLHQAFRACFAGEVADLAPYYRGARCVIAPMVSGSGISIKTIEALALSKPFVGTSKAFRGMPMERLEAAGIQAHDEPEGFADAIVRALCREHEAQAHSRAAYNSVFSQRACFASRDEALRTATASLQSMPLVRRLSRKAMGLLEARKFNLRGRRL